MIPSFVLITFHSLDCYPCEEWPAYYPSNINNHSYALIDNPHPYKDFLQTFPYCVSYLHPYFRQQYRNASSLFQSMTESLIAWTIAILSTVISFHCSLDILLIKIDFVRYVMIFKFFLFTFCIKRLVTNHFSEYHGTAFLYYPLVSTNFRTPKIVIFLGNIYVHKMMSQNGSLSRLIFHIITLFNGYNNNLPNETEPFQCSSQRTINHISKIAGKALKLASIHSLVRLHLRSSRTDYNEHIVDVVQLQTSRQIGG